MEGVAHHKLYCDDMVDALTASMSSYITKIVESMSAGQIWKTLISMYSGKGNVMMMIEIQGKADVVK
jgi:hypothetical protein